MERKKITLLDIANELGVTPSTVSRALSDHPRISKSTKKKVREIVERLNYRPNNIAAALRKGRSGTIGVIVPTSDRRFFASIIRGIDEVASPEGYNLIICQSDDKTEKEIECIESLLQIQVDGIIASVAKETIDVSHYNRIGRQGIPLILYDRVSDMLEVNTVVSDDSLGAYKAVTHLIEQGCKRIAHFGGQLHLSIYEQRLKGYKDALLQNDIPIREEDIHIFDLIKKTDDIVEAGHAMMKQILQSSDELPDGIFSSSDFAAIGAMKALKSAGIRIPEEMALVGYSNDFSASVVDPGLTSVDQLTKRMGRFAGRLFFEQINMNESELTPRRTSLNPVLVVRDSSLKKEHAFSYNET